MEPRRLLHIFRARWWLIGLIAIAGVAVAVFFAHVSNGNITPRFEAQATIRIVRLTNESDVAYESRLEGFLEQAQAALETELQDPDFNVRLDVPGGALHLVAAAPTAEEAESLASDLRKQFLEAETLGGSAEQILTALKDLEADVLDLRAQIAEKTTVPEISPAEESLRLLLETELNTLEFEMATLDLQIRFPERFPRVGIEDDQADLLVVEAEPPSELSEAELEAELANMSRIRDQLRAALAELPTPPPENQPTDLEVLVLQRRLTDLENQFVELSVQLLTADDNESALDPFIPVSDETRQEQPLSRAAAVGLFGGGLLALMALLALDRVRQPMLGLEDVVSHSPLGLIQRSRPTSTTGAPWYPDAVGRRRRQIQVIRSGIESAIGDTANTVVFAGVSVRSVDVREVAADVAGAFAAAGRQVLLIDATSGEGARMPEYDMSTPDLTDLLTSADTNNDEKSREDVSAAIKNALVERRPVSPGLVSIGMGSGRVDKVDLFASVAYRTFLDLALSQFEVVIVAGPELNDPTATVLARRSDAVVLVGAMHQTTETDLDEAYARLAQSDARTFVTLLEGRTGEVLSSTRSTAGSAATRTARKVAKVGFAAADLLSRHFPGPRILLYHQIGTELGREMEVSTHAFAKQLDWMARRGEIVDLEVALDFWSEFAAHRLFVVTFDDGYEDVYHNAFPLLREQQIPFTLYLTTQAIETGEPLSPHYPAARPLKWDQIHEMVDSGLVTIGAHTHTHPDLRKLTIDEITAELETSDDLIEANTGIRPKHFSYPYGYWSQAAHSLIVKRYETATVGSGPPIDDNTYTHAIPRMPVEASDGVWLFHRRMKRGFRLEDRLRRRLRGYSGP